MPTKRIKSRQRSKIQGDDLVDLDDRGLPSTLALAWGIFVSGSACVAMFALIVQMLAKTSCSRTAGGLSPDRVVTSLPTLRCSPSPRKRQPLHVTHKCKRRVAFLPPAFAIITLARA